MTRLAIQGTDLAVYTNDGFPPFQEVIAMYVALSCGCQMRRGKPSRASAKATISTIGPWGHL